mgnify:CR=1 FL=1
MAQIVDCTQGGTSFSLEDDDAPTPAQVVCQQMDDAPSRRTTRASRTSAYECESTEETARHQGRIQLLCRYGESSNFGAFLHSHGFRLTPAHLRTLSTDDLDDTLVRVRACVDTGHKERVQLLGGGDLRRTQGDGNPLREQPDQQSFLNRGAY